VGGLAAGVGLATNEGRPTVDRFQRIFALHRALKGARVPVTRAQLQERLECEAATVKRVILALRNEGAPIEYVRDPDGYRFASGSTFELPGVWFSP